MVYLFNPHNNWFKSPLVGMQPFKLVPSLSARIPGRSASPLRLKPLKPSQAMGTSRNREPNPVNPQMDQICELQQLCSTHAVTYLIVFVTNGYTYGNLWSCANAIMNSTARRYPSYILKEHQLELVLSLLPYSIVVVHISHP